VVVVAVVVVATGSDKRAPISGSSLLAGGVVKAELLVPKLASAKECLAKAETDLERAMTSLGTGVRAEKVAISAVLGDAFERLRAARRELAEIEAMVSEEKTPTPT
jgi:hypothetical protein